MGLMASWKVGNKAMEIQCLMYLAYVRVFQGRLQEGVAFGSEVLGKSRELPERAEAMGSPAISLGLLASGEYEEALEVCLRGTELARLAQDMFLLWHNLAHLRRTYEALLDLQEARKVYEEALELGGQLGPHYEVLSSASLCAVAALSENWRRLTPTPGEHTKQAPPSMCLMDSTSITRSRRCCVEGTSDAPEKWCDISPTDRGRTGGNA
jgi:tetratricopeptide (TPR) repeat protein